MWLLSQTFHEGPVKARVFTGNSPPIDALSIPSVKVTGLINTGDPDKNAAVTAAQGCPPLSVPLGLPQQALGHLRPSVLEHFRYMSILVSIHSQINDLWKEVKP